MSSESAARATTVSGPVISVTPLSVDLGRMNVGSMANADYAISNTGDASLNLSSPTWTGPVQSVILSPLTIPAGGSGTMTVNVMPMAGGPFSGTATINSDAANGPFTVNFSGMGNTAPMLDPIGDKSGFAFVNLAFDVTASDAEGDALTFGVAGLPVGATFDSNTGHFDWTPGAADAGSY
ncbi:MAG TPA: choice-of-anchor D domain-containing protein, partial [Candidatus Eisenbacteria bacterium]|nr:choice-of-anchor D domain-containing protein [Candidatus Eisenbacteria bacterium]